MDTDSFSYEPFVCSSCRVSTSLVCAVTTERLILESWIKWSGILTYKKAVWLLSLWCSYNLNAVCCAHLSGIGCGPSTTQRNGLKWPDRKKQTYKSSNVFFSFNKIFFCSIFSIAIVELYSNIAVELKKNGKYQAVFVTWLHNMILMSVCIGSVIKAKLMRNIVNK